MMLRTTVFALSVMLFGVAAAGPEQAYDVMPSGDGVADADNIQLALENCAPGGTVTLAPGQYSLIHDVYVQGFDGTLQGAGKDETIITVSSDVVWEQRPWPYLGGQVVGGATFVFENPQGTVKISDLTVAVEAPDVAATFITLIGGDYDSTLESVNQSV